MAFQKIITTDDAPATPDDFRAVFAKLNNIVDGINGLLGNANFRIKDDGTAQWYDVTDGLWHTTWIEDVDGVPVFKMSDTGEA